MMATTTSAAASVSLSKSSARCQRPAARAAVAARCAHQGEEAKAAATIRTRVATAALAAALSLSSNVAPAAARIEGVNKPELLPKEFTTVIDVAGFLTPGEEERVAQKIERLEKDTGYKLRVLAQNYPETPGLAIRDYWGVDEDTVVFVADPNFGNILNFNVGANIDLQVPPNFWTRLTSKFGTKKYWSTSGEDTAIVNSVAAIDSCLREPVGVGQCANIRGVME